MKDPSAPFASEVDRAGLANVTTPVIHFAVRLFNLCVVRGHVELTRPRLGAIFSCSDEKAEHAEWAPGRHLSRFPGPTALVLVGPNNERTGAYVTSLC